jgi:hypothetical protein
MTVHKVIDELMNSRPLLAKQNRITAAIKHRFDLVGVAQEIFEATNQIQQVPGEWQQLNLVRFPRRFWLRKRSNNAEPQTEERPPGRLTTDSSYLSHLQVVRFARRGPQPDMRENGA